LGQIAERQIQQRRRCLLYGGHLALTACAVATMSVPAAAQFGETARVHRPIPATNPLDPTAAGSEVLIRDRLVAQTTEQLLLESAGTRVVLVGGPGTPFCLRLRGVSCDQINVMLGEVPISSPDTGPFDLSLVPLEALDGFEVYRGGAPAWLHEGAIGGVLRLLPRRYEQDEIGARATAGSFGSWRANAFGAFSDRKVQAFATAGAAGSRNDYPYVDDNGTRFDPTDDVERRRSNADFLEGFGFANLVAQTSKTSRLDLVFLGLGRDRGEPGPGSSPATQAGTKTTRLIGTASWRQEKGGAHPHELQVAANYDYGRNRFDDELGEIGNGGPRQTDDQTHAVFGRVAASVEATPWLEVTSIASARYQAFDPSSDSAAILLGASDRISAAGTLEARLFGEAGKASMELRPSVRLAWTRAVIDQAAGATPTKTQSSDFLPTYRVGGAIAPRDWLSLRGSVSSGYKLPSLLQLFGNRSTVVPNTSLIPERSMAYDGAVIARGRAGSLSGYASVGAFSTHLDNAIRPRPLPQGTIIFENIGSARLRGVEIELRGAVTEHFVLQAETTWTQAIDEQRARQLPGQPQWVVFAQPEGHSGALSTWVSDVVGFFQIAYVGESFSDPANLIVLVPRTVLATGLGVDLLETRLGLSFRVDDLLDARGQDLLGFPLPGRRYTGRLSYRHTW
jgi:outer membrane receptor protein involved in Fe transport